MNFTHPIYYRLHCCIFHDTNYSLTIRKYHCKVNLFLIFSFCFPSCRLCSVNEIMKHYKVCGVAVLGKDNIMKHASDTHGGRGAYQCQYCRKFFLRLNYLEMHRSYGCSQNPQRSRPLCDFCGRKFCQPQKLKVHIKRMHSGECHRTNLSIHSSTSVICTYMYISLRNVGSSQRISMQIVSETSRLAGGTSASHEGSTSQGCSWGSYVRSLWKNVSEQEQFEDSYADA